MKPEIVEPETQLLVTPNEYAQSQGVTVRTVQNWMRKGIVETVEHHGRRFIDPTIAKTVVGETTKSGNATNALAFPSERILDAFLNEHRLSLQISAADMRKAERSRFRWQVFAFAMMFVWIITALAGVALCLYLYFGPL